MERTFREKAKLVFLKVVKRNRYLKLPMLLFMTIILSAYYVLQHFANNGKRYASIGFALIFFMLSSSFAFPVLADRGGFVSSGVQESAAAGQSAENTVTEESGAVPAQQSAADNIVILEDEDVLDGYEDEDFHGSEESDQYTLDEILEENELYHAERSSDRDIPEMAEAVFTTDDWRLMLINKQHPIPEDYTFDLVTIKGSMQCDERILDELLAMLQGAKDDGVNLVIRSPYRDMCRQEYLFDRKIKAYMNNGMSYMEAYKTASQAVTVPGASEHQIGLAIDITSDLYVALDTGFGETEAGAWLAEHSCEYGFILRYPEGKEYITSIQYEPWHFRYVGKEAATVISEKGITLEEFAENYL